MQNVKIKGRKQPIRWPVETMQMRRSVTLTEAEREKLKTYHKENGYKATMEKSCLTKATLYNILSHGFGREDNIAKIKNLIK